MDWIYPVEIYFLPVICAIKACLMKEVAFPSKKSIVEWCVISGDKATISKMGGEIHRNVLAKRLTVESKSIRHCQHSQYHGNTDFLFQKFHPDQHLRREVNSQASSPSCTSNDVLCWMQFRCSLKKSGWSYKVLALQTYPDICPDSDVNIMWMNRDYRWNDVRILYICKADFHFLQSPLYDMEMNLFTLWIDIY